MLDQDLCADEVSAVDRLSVSVRRGVSAGLSRGFEAAESVNSAMGQLGGSDMNGEDVLANYLVENKVARRNQISLVMGPSFDNGVSGPGPQMGTNPGL